jgi:hydrogenase expression/formation protein HypC
MCLGIPGEIVEMVDPAEWLAKVDVSGVQRVVSVRLLADEAPQVGDWVLVHVGFALSKIDEEEARLTLDQIQLLGRNYEEEMEAFLETEII